MKLMVDPDAEPVAHHTPVPVPLHWRDAVKAGIDHDVQLGVLEPVPNRGACYLVPQDGGVCKEGW